MEIITNGEDIHDHCLGCVKIWKCTVKPHNGESCEIVPCDLDCGARFHACKKEEHRLLCLNERVPCINAEYGCPSMMSRKYLGTHLNMCPASVIYCTMEWNRWPIPAGKGQLSQQCHHQVFHKPQLDVALAMRDQRMLKKRWRQSSWAHRVLKDDPHTKCSMLPFSVLKELSAWKSDEVARETEASQASGQTPQSSDVDVDVPSEYDGSKVRQQRIFRGEPYRASKKVAETLNATLNMIANHTGDIFQENANSDSSVLFDMDSVGARVLPSEEENKENIMDYVNHGAPVNNFSMCNYGIDREKTSHNSTPMDISPPVSSNYFDHQSDRNCTGNSDFTYEKVIELVCDCDVVFANDTVVSEISSASILDHARKDVNPPGLCPFHAVSQTSLWYPSSVPPWCSCLGLDLNVESITRYKAQPKSMYTFLCAQEFRRDEYAWHYKNVHSEIHGGLNGWLEERCPLAQYGCTFGRRRFYPAPKGSSIVHNEILESFGVKFPTTHIDTLTLDSDRIKNQRFSSSTADRVHQNTLTSDIFHETNNNRSYDIIGEEYSNSGINITQLPFEVLQYIASFLDSFSLCNLSLTTHLLRDVCRSMLEERGVVVYRWERQKTSKGVSWKVVCKRWFFSSSFSPIQQWCFEDGRNLSDHLKTCAYFNRNIKSDPYYYPMGLEPNHNTYQKLKNSIAETPRIGFENITTKL